jgi:hypothetical protein
MRLYIRPVLARSGLTNTSSLLQYYTNFPEVSKFILIFVVFTATIMGDIPSEQWAQVIEKTGGPVAYKKIPVQKPGPDEVLVNISESHMVLNSLQAEHALTSYPLLRILWCLPH